MIEDLDRLFEGSGQPGLSELRELLQDLLGGAAAQGRFLESLELKPQSKRVFRVRFAVPGRPDTVIVKRLSPTIADRIELAARRWLPAAGLGAIGPPLAGSVAARNGACVWHVYDDLGPHALDPLRTGPEPVGAAATQIARLHVLFARHPLLGEVRLRGSDLGMSFFKSNVRDATYALEAWPAGPTHAALRDQLLRRLDALRNEIPQREQIEAKWGGPETLLHGDLWAENVFLIPTEGGLRPRLIDWDHVGVGPFSYDLSTFLLRFPSNRRPSILDSYRSEVERHGWRLPGEGELNALFETAEYARFVNRLIWPAIALVTDHADWATDALAEVDGWFDEFQPVLSTANRSGTLPPVG